MITPEERLQFKRRNSGYSKSSWDEIKLLIGSLNIGDLIWCENWKGPSIAKFLGTHIGQTFGGMATYVDLEYMDGEKTSSYEYVVLRKLRQDEINEEIELLLQKTKFITN